jgi:predicted nuclease of predicted toxin-antitoxin system
VARVMADEDFPRPVAKMLREYGHDSITASELQLANKETPDSQILATATQLGRVVLTHNRQDYIRLHQSGTPHSGIDVCRHDVDQNRLAKNLDLALSACADMTNTLVRVYRNGTFRIQDR